MIVRFLSKLVGGHLLYCPVGTPNLVWIGWKLKKFPRNIFCCSVLWAARSVPQRWRCRRACLTAPSSRPLLNKIKIVGFCPNLLGNRPWPLLARYKSGAWWHEADPELMTNRQFSSIPQCTCPISHNTPLRTKMCAFLFWMLYVVGYGTRAVWDLWDCSIVTEQNQM